MREFDWLGHRLHRRQVVADEGQWVGLLDADGVPLMDMPPIITLEAPETRNAPASLQMKVVVRTPLGLTHRIVDELVGENLGVLEEDGQLRVVKDASRLVCVERPGDERRVYKVTHVVAEGPLEQPITLEIHGVDLLDMLGGLPCPSRPHTWQPRWETLRATWATPFTGKRLSQPRKTTGVKLAVTATDNTLSGRADVVIHGLISRSLEAVYRLSGRAPDRQPLVMGPLRASASSPELLLRPQDKYLWEEIQAAAMAAGVHVRVVFRMPGDEGFSTTRPVGVVEVEQIVKEAV